MSFFSSFFGVCRGVAAFEKVKNNSVLKTLCHLLLILIFCSLAIVCGSYVILEKYYWKYTKIEFKENFGDEIRLTEDGILPEKNADKNIRQELPADGLLVYIPSTGNPDRFPEDMLENRKYVIVWSSACFALAIREYNSTWSVVSNKEDFSRPEAKNAVTDEELDKEINEIAKMKPSDDWEIHEAFGKSIYTDKLFRDLQLLYSIVIVIGYFIKMLFLALVCSGIFALLSRVFNSTGLNAVEIWKVSIYAALPVLVVVSAFPMLHLPLMPYYGRLFVAGWMIYMGFVLHHFSKHRINPEINDDEKDFKNE